MRKVACLCFQKATVTQGPQRWRETHHYKSAFMDTWNVFLSTSFILSFKIKHPGRKKNILNFYLRSVFSWLLPHFLFPEPPAKLFAFSSHTWSKMSHFSFTIQMGDSFVRGWGVSARSFLKWSGKKKKRRNQKSKSRSMWLKAKFF